MPNLSLTPAAAAMVARHRDNGDLPGACTSCGKTYEDVDPAAVDDHCERCGQPMIHGCAALDQLITELTRTPNGQPS
jgi:predicted RNA-binding Zn-ribbon protein involved in translation (DUF1610 family)